MARVVYSPRADSDLFDIAATIAQDKPSAALEWVAKIRDTCDLLAERPQMGESRPGYGVYGCRCFSMGNYVIFFRAISGGIDIARIVHGSRDLRNLR